MGRRCYNSTLDWLIPPDPAEIALMPQFDADSLAEHAVLLGLITREQARTAIAESVDGTSDGLSKALLRKGYLTSWQLEKLLKGEPTGFFYGGCKVLFHVAEGSFARVYRGSKEPGAQPVAVKVLRKRFSTDPEAVKRFYHEAEAGMKLVHPNIVRINNYGEQDKAHYMTMEYVEGSNLRDFLKIRHRVPAEQAMPIMLGLAEGLNYSLAQGVTHRDLKATNVLISHLGQAKLVDFGLATIEGEDKKTAEHMHGVRTVDYASLERTCGSPKGDPRSDIFFLGCIFYRLLTGQPTMPETEGHDPLQKMLKRSFSAIKPISEHPYAPPPVLCAIIEKMMKMDLKQRYQNMEDVVAALKSYHASLTLPPPPPPVQARPRVAPPPAAPVEADASFELDAFETPAYHQKQVVCVEMQEAIQDALRKMFSELGYRVVTVRDGDRAIEICRESPPDLLVFDADGLGTEGLDAFQQIQETARDDGRELTAIVLLGPKQAKLHNPLPFPLDDRVVVLNKPIKLRQVQDALAQLVPSSG